MKPNRVSTKPYQTCGRNRFETKPNFKNPFRTSLISIICHGFCDEWPSLKYSLGYLLFFGAVQQNCFSLEYSNALLEVKSTVTAKDSDIEEKNTTIGQVIKTTVLFVFIFIYFPSIFVVFISFLFLVNLYPTKSTFTDKTRCFNSNW